MSDCRLALIAEHESGQYTYTCPRCRVQYQSRYTPDKIHRNCTAAKKCENAGPGTELERILKWFGVRVKRGCGCKDWVRWMNAIGVEGCREPANMAAIVERLRGDGWRRWIVPQCLPQALARWAIWRAR